MCDTLTIYQIFKQIHPQYIRHIQSLFSIDAAKHFDCYLNNIDFYHKYQCALQVISISRTIDLLRERDKKKTIHNI